MRSIRTAGLLTLAIVALLTVRGVAGQQQTGEQAMLTEVRALRVAIERLATSGARAQVLLGRVQLQEARMGEIGRRLQTVRDRLVAEERAAEDAMAQAKRLEDELKQVAASGFGSGFDPELAGRKARAKQLLTSVQLTLYALWRCVSAAPFCSIRAQVSRKDTVRLKTRAPGRESGSTQK